MLSKEIAASFAGRKVLVTGGTGLVGRQVVNLLCDMEAQVTSISLDDLVVDPRADYQKVDLSDFKACLQLTKNVDDVFHIAGIKGSINMTIQRPASFFVPLLMMNTNLLEAARVNKVSRLVYTSSIGAYQSAEIFKESDAMLGNPMDMHPGWAKRIAEMQLQAYQTEYNLDHFSAVRLCNVYGPGDNFDPDNAMVIPSLLSRIADGEDPLLVWGDGSAIRDFAFSRDVAKGIILALYHGTAAQPINLASGVGVSIADVLKTLAEFIDFHYDFDTSKNSGFPVRVMDVSLAKERLGYVPETSLREGLQETWEWFLENREEFKKRKNYFATSGEQG